MNDSGSLVIGNIISDQDLPCVLDLILFIRIEIEESFVAQTGQLFT